MWYVWITCVNHFTVTFHFRHCDVCFILSQLRYWCFYYNSIFLIALKSISFWYVMHKIYVIIRLFLGLSLWDTFIMWQLHFFRFLNKIFLIILEICYLLVRSNYLSKYDTITFLIFGWLLVWYVCITHWNKVTATSRFCSEFWHIFWRHNYVMYLFDVVTLEWRYILVRLYYVWK